VGYNGSKTPVLWDTTEEKFSVSILQQRKTLLLYTTREGNLLYCGIQRRKTSSTVSHNARNAAALYHTTAKNNFNNSPNINFSADEFFTNETGS
jgi:hypothetical protein